MQTSTIPTRLTTIRGVMDRFQVSDVTVRRWIAAGKLTAYRVGGRTIRLDADEVDGLMVVAPAADFEVAK